MPSYAFCIHPHADVRGAASVQGAFGSLNLGALHCKQIQWTLQKCKPLVVSRLSRLLGVFDFQNTCSVRKYQRVPGDFKEGFASGSAFPHRAGEINGPAELHGPLVNQL